MSPDYPEADCGMISDVLADGRIAALGLQLLSDVSTAAACAEDGGAFSGLALNIVLGTPQFVYANLRPDGGPLIQALSPGVYTLENEGVSDQDLCTISVGADAVMTEFEFTAGVATPLYNGVGTVTITQFDGNTLVASLDAWLVAVDGGLGVDGGPLTGNFSASFCP
jgi:hypothetical protein